jgi:O-antigen/teichoic acid export membrane protein
MFNRLYKSASIYLFSTILNASIPFLLIPIFTRNMGAVEYGTFSMFQLTLLLLGPIAGLSINGAITRQYFDRDKINFPNYVTNCLYVLAVSGVVLLIFSFVAQDLVYSLTDLTFEWIALAVLVSISQFVFQVALVIFQVQSMAIKYGIFLITQSLINGLLSIFFVVVLNGGWEGAALGFSLSYIIYGIIGFFILIKGKFIEHTIHTPYIKGALDFGIPLIPVAIGMVLINMLDRLFIKNMVGLEAVGLYTIGYQISMILMIFINGFNKAWVPWLFDRLKKESVAEKLRIVRFTYLYFGFLILAAVLLGLLSPFILEYYVSEQFQEASIFVIWIALGYALNGMYKMMTNYVHYAKKTKYNFWVLLIAVPINIILNYYFISWFGPIGAAQATTISFLVAFIAMWLLSAKIYPMPWFFRIKNKRMNG